MKINIKKERITKKIKEGYIENEIIKGGIEIIIIIVIDKMALIVDLKH